MNKTLVTYFSASGQTEKLAKTLAEVINGDLFEIRPVQKYTSADLNWNNKGSRSSIEMNDKASRPEIVDTVSNMNSYNTVFVGFPIWWYEAPRIIQTFLESYDFAGKTIIPFATSGGSSIGKTGEILMSSCGGETNWKPGSCLRSNASAENVRKWVNSLDI